tara:strand:+ start:157 stop:390 length:234 start_codon:yes stop_codon:yes gene_type:complete
MRSTARYYARNPEARKKRLIQQTEYEKQPHRRKNRSKLAMLNRKIGRVGDGKDVSHRKDGSVFLEKQSKNRARKGKA